MASARLWPRLALNDRNALIRLLEQNPLAAWVGGKGTAGVSYFSYRDETFQTTFTVKPDSATALQETVRELAEWRPTEYLDRARTQTAGFSTLKVSQASGRPILFLPPEPERSDLPEGWTDVVVDDATYSANFVRSPSTSSAERKTRRTSSRRSCVGGSAPMPGPLAHGAPLRLN